MTTAKISPLQCQVRGDGAPVLFIQGVGVHGSGWQPQVEELAARFRCLRFDNRGLGQNASAGPLESLEQMADDALALLDAQGWDSAHVVGHSMGGLIAQCLALKARTRVRSLALLNTFARGRDVTRPTPFMIWIGLRTRLGPRAWRRRAFLELIFPSAALAQADRDALAEKLAPVFGHDLGDQPAIVMKQLAAMSRYDATPRLGELAGVPTLVVTGAHDRVTPPALGRALAVGIPGARHVEFEDAAHGLPIQFAARTNELLAGHFTAAEAR